MARRTESSTLHSFNNRSVRAGKDRGEQGILYQVFRVHIPRRKSFYSSDHRVILPRNISTTKMNWWPISCTDASPANEDLEKKISNLIYEFMDIPRFVFFHIG